MEPKRKLTGAKRGDPSFMDEIALHLNVWKHDTRFKKLHKFVRDGIEVLDRQLRMAESSIEAEKSTGGDKEGDKYSRGARKFIFIFKSRYLDLTDLECPETISPATFHIIKDLMRKLIDAGSSPEEYLTWFYDEVAGSNSLSPTLALALSNAIFSKFVFANSDELKQRRNSLSKHKMGWRALLAATLVYEETKSDALRNMYDRYKDGRLHEELLFQKAMEIAEENGIKGIIEAKLKEEMDREEAEK